MDLTTEERGQLHRIFVAEWQEWFDVDPQPGCWLWKRGKMSAGYGVVWVRSSCQRAHRVSYAYHVGPIPEGKVIMHKCDVRLCVNPEHLQPGTPQENTSDMVVKGRNSRKLSDDQVRQIRWEHVELGISRSELGARYGVTSRLISYILRRESWAHLS